jgi:hypothetical protein
MSDTCSNPSCSVPNPLLSLRRGLQSLVEHDSAGNDAANDHTAEQQPTPVLAGIPHGANEVPSVMLGEDGD